MNAFFDWLLINDISAADIVLNTILAVVGIAVIVSMWRLHKGNGRYSEFNVVDLICTPRGKISRPAVMEFGVFVLMCWGFILFMTRGNLPEWFVMMFVGAFVMRAAYAAYLGAKDSRIETETVTEPVRSAPMKTTVTQSSPAPSKDSPMPVELTAGAGVKTPLKVSDKGKKK